MAEKERTLRVEAEKCFLSSESRVFKTEQFIKETRRMSGADDFLFKIAEGILSSLRDFSFERGTESAYFASTEGGEHSFLFRFGCQIDSDLPLLTARMWADICWRETDTAVFQAIAAYGPTRSIRRWPTITWKPDTRTPPRRQPVLRNIPVRAAATVTVKKSPTKAVSKIR